LWVDEGMPAGVNATAYGVVQGRKRMKLAVFNKDAGQGLDLSILMAGGLRKATAWRLEVTGGAARMLVAAAGAALVFLG
jgi:hypothetical protein